MNLVVDRGKRGFARKSNRKPGQIRLRYRRCDHRQAAVIEHALPLTYDVWFAGLRFTRPVLGHYIASREELLGRAEELFGWVGGGELSVRIGAEFPLASVAEAHAALEGRRTTGKVLLRIGG